MKKLKKEITGIIGNVCLNAGSTVPGEVADKILSLIAKSDGGAEVTLDCLVIKPCPHCGNEPEIRKRKTVIIECKGCGAL